MSGVLASAAAPAGGWCAVLRHPAGTLLTAADVNAVIAYVFDWMTHNGYGLPGGIGPAPWAVPIYLQMQNTLQGGLMPMVGRVTCDGLPANLEDVPGVKAATPPSDVGGVLNAIIDWSGLGDVIVKAAVLVGILVLVLIAIRRVLE